MAAGGRCRFARGFRRLLCWGFAGATVLLPAGNRSLHGASSVGGPAISQVYPAGGQSGTRFTIELLGTWPEWPVRGWAAAEGIRLAPETEAGRFRVEILPGALPGPTLLRFWNSEGATAPVQFVVSDSAEVVESAEMEASGAGVPIRLFPVVINGRLLTRDRPDQWLLPVARPVQLTATLVARGLDSPLRARLELAGDQGQLLSEATTTPGSEPSLSTTLAVPGVYVLRVSAAVGESGDPDGVGPTALYRLGVVAEELPDASGDAASPPPSLSPDIQRPLLSSKVLSPPDTMVAFIGRPGRVGVFGVEARAGQRYTVRVTTGVGGVRFVARLEIDNSESATIASDEGEEVELEFVSPRTGLHTFRVSAADGGGGPGHGYSISVTRNGPDFDGEVSADRVVLSPGGITPLRLRVRRPPDYRGVLSASVDRLPPGVTANNALLPPGMDTVDLVLRASAGASPANQPFQVNLLPIGGALPTESPATAPITGRHATSPMLLTGTTADLWLTVTGPPAE